MVQKRRKIAILGTGNVGATIAYTLAFSGICSEIVLVDINKEKAEGEALDIAQCAACEPSVKVWSGDYKDVKGSDIVVVTFGIARKPDQTRLDLAKVNIGILKSVMPNVAKIAPKALYVIVSNPVDVLTYTTIKCTGLPKNQVIGTGTLLDTNRLSQAISTYCKVDITNVNSFVFGEHGDACIVPWSLCSVSGLPLKTYCKTFLGISDRKLNDELYSLYTGIVKSGAKVIKAKGATYYAIAASVYKLICALLSDTDTVLPLSALVSGEYGANDLCMGVPCVVGGSGLKKILELPITKEEQAAFDQKIASLNFTYDALDVRK